jgi:hypothetical protein
MSDEWVGIDLDGTLAYYEKHIEGYIGDPVPIMMQRVKQMIKEGKTVKIFTARAEDEKNIPLIKEWLKKHGLEGLEVTNKKDHEMVALYDDRAFQVIKNLGITLNELFQHTRKEGEKNNEK